MGTRAVAAAVISVKMEHEDKYINSDHKSFIIQLNSKKMLRTSISQATGSRDLHKDVKWEKIMKRVEEEFKSIKIAEDIEKLGVNNEEYEAVDRLVVKITRETLKKGKNHRKKRG